VGGESTITLTDFVLGYSTDLSSIPTDLEVEEVAGVTQVYLDQYFRENVKSATGITTTLLDHRLKFGSPYEIDYGVQATVADDGSIDKFLEPNLVIAFSGQNQEEYIDLLQELGADNIFCTYRKNLLLLCSG